MTISQIEARLTSLVNGTITMETMRRINRLAKVLAKATGKSEQHILAKESA